MWEMRVFWFSDKWGWWTNRQLLPCLSHTGPSPSLGCSMLRSDGQCLSPVPVPWWTQRDTSSLPGVPGPVHPALLLWPSLDMTNSGVSRGSLWKTGHACGVVPLPRQCLPSYICLSEAFLLDSSVLVENHTVGCSGRNRSSPPTECLS